MEFEVWAPAPERVELVLRGERHGMERGGGGWWTASVDASHGDDYGFSLDGGDPLPDPRSPWQPRGVHGLSRVLDHSRYEWRDGGWRGRPIASAIVYELHTGTFTSEGTFRAAIGKLDHLVRLGVTHVELLPVAQFPGDRGWGYDGVDLFAPHESYGGPEGLKELVDACHARGLGVIVDVVYNHLGPAGNYLGSYGPYFTDRYATPWGQAVNFDGPGSLEVRRFFVDNALTWLRDYHCDGLRLDAIHAILDASAVHILEEMQLRVEELEAHLDRDLFLVAESDLNDPRVVNRREAGGYGLDAQWSDDFHHALHSVLTGERDGYYADFGTIGDVATALRHAFVYAGTYSRYRDRIHGRPATGLPGYRFLGYLQNHDQIGNRAVGERSSALTTTDLLRVGAALVLTSPFVPMLFMGEEWGATSPFLYFTAHEDPELGQAVSEGRKREFAAFGWDPGAIPDPQDPATFERSKLDWSELDEQPHADLLEWHRSLIALRREWPELTDGRLDRVEVAYDEDARWLTTTRGRITVACNFGPGEVAVPVRDALRGRLLLTSGKEPSGAGPNEVRLPGESVTIWARA
ncbi:MAG TPA: malto-oligosyltrehalose trehalohydrolase [Actinomycetota bacterium]|nr:malto-oligosyltrehalose trehalohydrolase [Actinomycetota bacterium]